VVCKVTHSLVTWFRKYIQADEGNSEQLAWVETNVNCTCSRNS
jgi:hypothetical protein